jgi:glutamate N-acetyltransferase/amino-acid N-acetyltransferase
MLAFITTDAILPSSVLQSTLRLVADETFNMVSVDGDTSTNDMLLILAPGTDAGTMKANGDNHDYAGFFRTALQEVCRYLAVEIARDGEGASKLLRCRVEGAASLSSARLLAKEVIGSSLVKCAFFGEDANWGRIIAAMGYSGVEFTEESVSISFRSFDQSKTVSLMKDGTPIVFSEEKASEILSEKEIEIFISMNDGSASATAWGCDLTYDYVKINGDYRT